jgi:quinol monooxygenase YgiN
MYADVIPGGVFAYGEWALTQQSEGGLGARHGYCPRHRTVDPARRDEFLVQRAESMRISRAEPGNLEYVIAADPIETDRVIVSERWETQEHLTAHAKAAAERRRQAAPDDGSQVPVEFTFAVYEIASTKPLG